MHALRKTICLGGWQHWLWALVSLPTCRSTPVIGKHVDWSFSQGCRDACCRQASLFPGAAPGLTPCQRAAHAASERDRAACPGACGVLRARALVWEGSVALIDQPPARNRSQAKKYGLTVGFPVPPRVFTADPGLLPTIGRKRGSPPVGGARTSLELSPTRMRRCGGGRP
jgi:hypothetical protein